MKTAWTKSMVMMALVALTGSALAEEPIRDVRVWSEGEKKTHNPEAMAQLAMVLLDQDPGTATLIARNGALNYPTRRGFHLVLGVLHERKGEVAEAYWEYAYEILLTGPGSETGETAAEYTARLMGGPPSADRTEVRNVMGALQKMSWDDPQGATRILTRILAGRGERIALLDYRAGAEEAAGDHRAAQADYRRALELAPSLAPVWVELSESLQRSGDEGAASAALAKAREIDPQSWRLSPQ